MLKRLATQGSHRRDRLGRTQPGFGGKPGLFHSDNDSAGAASKSPVTQGDRLHVASENAAEARLTTQNTANRPTEKRSSVVVTSQLESERGDRIDSLHRRTVDSRSSARRPGRQALDNPQIEVGAKSRVVHQRLAGE